MMSTVHARRTTSTLAVATALWLSLATTFPAEKIGAAQTYREAYDLGYEDGQQAGIQDQQQQRLFDLANRKEFQTADHGYQDERHEREVFLVAYRRGFEDGYEEGYGLNLSSSDPDSSSPPPTPAPPARPPASSLRPAAGPTILPNGTEFGVELLDTLSTRFNEKGDTFRARVFRDVRLHQGIVIPAGTQLYGRITHLKRAGRIRGRAQMSLRFDELRFLDGRNIAFEATLVGIDERSDEKLKDEEGTIEASATKGKDMGKIGKTSAVGALIGVVAGGKTGAGVGALGGAAVGLGRVLLTRGKDAQLEARTRLRIRLTQDLELE